MQNNTTTKPLNQNRMKWKTDNPKKIGEYICRMDNAYKNVLLGW